MSERPEHGVYRDPLYCCMDCGCEWFKTTAGLRDRCNSCGSLRDNKRGPTDVDDNRLATDGGKPNNVEKQRRLRQRSPEQPRVNLLADGYDEWYLDFCPTGDASRSELAAEFFEHAADAARRYVDMEQCSRPAPWNGYTRDPESRMWMHKHYDRRKAWAKSIDLLWQYSDGDAVDADALREALVRMSLRRHSAGSSRDHNEEHVFSKAAGIVRERADLQRMHDERDKAVQADYR